MDERCPCVVHAMCDFNNVHLQRTAPRAAADDVPNRDKRLDVIIGTLGSINAGVTHVSAQLGQSAQGQQTIIDNQQATNNTLSAITAGVTNVSAQLGQSAQGQQTIIDNQQATNDTLSAIAAGVTNVSEQTTQIGADVAKVSAQTTQIGADVAKVSAQLDQTFKDIQAALQAIKIGRSAEIDKLLKLIELLIEKQNITAAQVASLPKTIQELQLFLKLSFEAYRDDVIRHTQNVANRPFPCVFAISPRTSEDHETTVWKKIKWFGIGKTKGVLSIPFRVYPCCEFQCIDIKVGLTAQWHPIPTGDAQKPFFSHTIWQTKKWVKKMAVLINITILAYKMARVAAKAYGVPVPNIPFFDDVTTIVEQIYSDEAFEGLDEAAEDVDGEGTAGILEEMQSQLTEAAHTLFEKALADGSDDNIKALRDPKLDPSNLRPKQLPMDVLIPLIDKFQEAVCFILGRLIESKNPPIVGNRQAYDADHIVTRRLSIWSSRNSDTGVQSAQRAHRGMERR